MQNMKSRKSQAPFHILGAIVAISLPKTENLWQNIPSPKYFSQEGKNLLQNFLSCSCHGIYINST
jgi:hypothetical protein